MDDRYLGMLVKAIRVCGSYKPMMGRKDKTGVDLNGFRRLYQTDHFYHWFGLDNPLMYAAHKAAGGMTSIYRQIGIGVEQLFRQVLQDVLGLTAEQSTWSYALKRSNKKLRKLSLDGRIDLGDVTNDATRERISDWIEKACRLLGVDARIAGSLRGAVFEVRQGYKSKDSKRQNADIANATTAYTKAYLPCVVVLSTQIDEDICYRYTNEKWLVLKGTPASGSPLESTYAFFRTVVGYDLQGFFERNSSKFRQEIDAVLKKLLSTE
ncbi:MAG: hypothetical protein HZA50_00870 [Planctomycetes bacterium]|nr:hypothetical protein [Planctomycetota bacterium]